MYSTARQLLRIVSLAIGSLAWTFGAPINGGHELSFEVISDRSFDVPLGEYEVIKRAPDQSVYLYSPKSKLLVRIPPVGGGPETIGLDKILPDAASSLRKLHPALAFDPEGNVYLAAVVPGRGVPVYGVYAIDPAGAFVKKVEFDRVDKAWPFRDFAVDSNGSIFVLGPGIRSPLRDCLQIHQYQVDGHYLSSFPPCRPPVGLARELPQMDYSGGGSTPLWIANDRIHYIPPKDDRLMVFGADGTPPETKDLISPFVEPELRKRGFLVTPQIPAEVVAALSVGQERLLLAWRRSGMLYVSLHFAQGPPQSTALPATRMDRWPLACDANGECDVVWQTGPDKVVIRRVRIGVR